MTAPTDTSFFGHPRGLSTLFFTEMWERFSYYGTRAILILFMTAAASKGGLGFDAARASAIYGLYTSIAYMLALPGGWMADRFLGQQRAVFWGGLLIAAGNAGLAMPSVVTFYLGLGLVAIGTGFLKPNVSTIVGHLYGPNDNRRDAGFSIFYMGINLGALISPLICGTLGEKVNWRLGFAVASVGMALGLIQYQFGRKHFGDAGREPVKPESAEGAAEQRKHLFIGVGATFGVLALVGVLGYTGIIGITAERINLAYGILLGITVVGVIVWLMASADWTAEERRRLIAVFAFLGSSAIFWSVFEQAGSTLNLFADRKTQMPAVNFPATSFGWLNNAFSKFASPTANGYHFEFPASWFQSLNSIFIVFGMAAFFAWMWIKLGKHDPSSPTKFTIGLVFVALGFLVLVPAAASDGRVSPLWLTLTYFLHTIGELCLSPVGLSAMTKLAPVRIGGMVMGLWFLATSLGNFLGGRMAGLYESLALPKLFGAVGLFALAAAVLMALLIRPVNRMMGDVK